MHRLKMPEGTEWHVSLRGTRRLVLFHDNQDYLTFFRFMEEALEVSQVTAIAYCLMSNHFHLALRGSSAQLGTCMHRLDRAYSGYHNRKYDLSGHIAEQPYWCHPALNDYVLTRVVRYIHLNPFRAGLVGRPETYPWSNCIQYFAGTDPRVPCDDASVLARFCPSPAIARKGYRAFVDEDMLRKVKIAPDATSAQELWQEQFRWILDTVHEQSALLEGISPQAAAIVLARRVGIPPRAIGRALGHANGHRVSQSASAWKRLLRKEPDLEARIQSLRVV